MRTGQLPSLINGCIDGYSIDILLNVVAFEGYFKSYFGLKIHTVLKHFGNTIEVLEPLIQEWNKLF
jgi:hypothetical protein